MTLVGTHLGDDGDIIQTQQQHAGDGSFIPIGMIQTDLGELEFHENPPAELTVSIDGPDEVPPDESCIWQAFASGGNSPYSYEWSGGLTGSGSSVSGIINQDTYLQVTVTDDDDREAGDAVNIVVDEQLEECFF